jgi:hypothetical protein
MYSFPIVKTERLWWRVDHSRGGEVSHIRYLLDPLMAYRLGLGWGEFDGLANPYWKCIPPVTP